MKKVGICGHFGGDQVFLDGQTVKTKIITSELKKQLGDEEVMTIDTYGGIKKIFFQLKHLYGLMSKCKNIIILPAHNSLRIFAPYLSILNRFKHCRLHYIVIGGWLPYFVKERKWLDRCLKKFDYIYVETSTMKNALESQGYNNIVIMPNCKDLQILREEELVYSYVEPYRLCTFSRVTEKKGIDDAVEGIIAVNKEVGRTVFTLDIYGQVDEEYKEHFEALMASSPESVNYKGTVAFDQSVDILKKYYALLFPTKFYTEGIPGTIIDAYAAGVPVIASKWENYDDIVDEGIVGKGFEFNNQEELKNILLYITTSPECLIQMKKNCLIKAADFSANKIVSEIIGGGTCRKIIGEKALKLCTFSRVMKEKGIEDAILAVKQVNNEAGKIVFELDIYGQIDKLYTEDFENLRTNFPEYIRYRGLVPYDKSVQTLKEYYALLFPTYYEGEGFAGTILDAMASGVPIIASDWRYNKDIINENIGMIFKTHDVAELKGLLQFIKENNAYLNRMKTKCIKEATKFQPKNAIKVLNLRL